MHGSIAHLTSSPVLGKSLASFLGRNDAAINLALELVSHKPRVDVAIFGSGIFEPITTAASLRLSPQSSVTAYDKSPLVISGLNSILNNTLQQDQPSVLREWQPWLQTPEHLTTHLVKHLKQVGVDTSLLWDHDGRLAVSKHIASVLTVRSFDLTQLQPSEQALWDVIVSINVLPNISIELGPGAVDNLLTTLWRCLRPGGVALIGTINSHFYPSLLHPEGSEHFSAEVAEIVKRSPWSLLGWIDRAYVNEQSETRVLLDGYMYLFLGKQSADFSSHLFRKGIPRPQGIPSRFFQEVCFDRREIWQRSGHNHLLAAVRSDAGFKAIRGFTSFPHSIESFFAATNAKEISLGICERLLLPVRK